jgi:hypothetical protein
MASSLSQFFALRILGVGGFFTGSFQAFQGTAIWFACFLAILLPQYKAMRARPDAGAKSIREPREGT